MEIPFQPDSFWRNLEDGKARARERQFDSAINAFTNVILELRKEFEHPDKATLAHYGAYCEARFRRGLAYTVIGKQDDAIDDFSVVIATPAPQQHRSKTSPFLAHSHLERGILNESRGEFDSALADFDAAICLNPQNFDAYYRRGLLYRFLNETEKHRADFRRARKIDPKTFEKLEPYCLNLPHRDEHVTFPDSKLSVTVSDGALVSQK